MQFFLYEILARVVAAYLFFDSGRDLWRGLLQRKIVSYNTPDMIDWIVDLFTDRSRRILYRDATPVQYWLQIGLQVIAVIGCFVVAIFGWFPSS